MVIEDELARQRAAAARTRAPEEQRMRLQAVANVRDSGVLEHALLVGDTLPAIALPDAAGGIVDVADLLAQGPVVISFYRGGWCPYCNIELRGLQRRLAEIRELGATLVAISPEMPDSALTTVEKNELTFPVLSDAANRVARVFGIVHSIDPAVVGFQRRNGVDVAAANGADIAEVPVPATYVADRRGVVRFAAVDPDYTRRAEPDEVIAALRALVDRPAASESIRN
jgi:peroxiredoxin